jgi:hypothetical protein
LGTPLKVFRERGGLGKDGALQWKTCGRNTLNQRQERKMVVEIKHADGYNVDVPAYALLTVEHMLVVNWIYWSAQVQRSPLPPIQVRMFSRRAALGLTNTAYFRARPPRSSRPCATMELHQYVSAKKSIAAKSTPGATVAGLREIKLDKTRLALEKARVTAQATMATKKKRRSILVG